MDVTCERCGTEYEFDETLLSGSGTSVKCTNCGHVFKVYLKGETDSERDAGNWRLRLEDGSIDEIDSLRELQRRISSGELTPENEISRAEDGWKALGSIPELETFFQAAGIPVASRPSPSPLPPPPSPLPPASGPKESSAPPGRRPRQPTLLGVPPIQKWVADEPPTATERAPKPDSPSVSTDSATSASEGGMEPAPVPVTESAASIDPTPAPVGIEDAEFEDRPASASSSAIRPSTPPPAYYDDDDDIPALPARGGSPLRWLLLVVVLGGLVLIVAQWPRIASLLGIGGNPALIAAGISDGDAGIAEGDPRGYAIAIEAYGRAIDAGADRDPELWTKLSNAYALAAQAEVDAGANPERAASLAATALKAAGTAMDLEPETAFELKLARADALRLAGEPDEARKVLEAARSMPFSRTAEFFRVDARLSAAEAGGDLENGLRSAKQAAENAPKGVRYLLLVARAERAAGETAQARAALTAILEEHPEHPVARVLLSELDATAPLADAGVNPDAGVAELGPDASAASVNVVANTAAAPKPAESTEAPRPPKEQTVRKAPGKTTKPARRRREHQKPEYDEYDRLAEAAGDDAFVDGRPPVRDYSWYMHEGHAELAAGNYARARAFFDSALEARPGSADAMDGLGRLSIQIEDFDSALRYFRVAAQRGHPDGYFNLGKTYERLGRKEEAVSAYYTYVKRRPSGTHTAAARSKIKALEPRAQLPPEPEPSPEPETAPQPEPSADAKPPQTPAQQTDPATP